MFTCLKVGERRSTRFMPASHYIYVHLILHRMLYVYAIEYSFSRDILC